MSDAYQDRSPADASIMGSLPADGPPEPAVALDQAFDAGTLPDLRKAVLAAAVAAGLPDDRAADVMLVVHELAANAVRHGGGAGRARMRVVAGVLQCQVSDTGPGRSEGHARSGGAADAEPWPVQRGHGLWLVRNTADRINITAGPGGSRVTVVFAMRPQSSAASLPRFAS
ncbi:MAG: ATP-binding protein [Actinobacteria bacterium]|nr:ATP-binding protein [Actinomycetota bacterium]